MGKDSARELARQARERARSAEDRARKEAARKQGATKKAEQGVVNSAMQKADRRDER